MYPYAYILVCVFCKYIYIYIVMYIRTLTHDGRAMAAGVSVAQTERRTSGNRIKRFEEDEEEEEGKVYGTVGERKKSK